jgi:hypothetical protein
LKEYDAGFSDGAKLQVLSAVACLHLLAYCLIWIGFCSGGNLQAATPSPFDCGDYLEGWHWHSFERFKD